MQNIDYRPSPEHLSREFPYTLTTGRSLYQFNVGSMSMRTPNKVLRPTDTLDISLHDARLLDIASGDTVRVTSRYGAVQIAARVSDTVDEGEVFATFQDPKVWLNRLTGPHRDRIVQAPEYKVTAVRVEKRTRPERSRGTKL